jgi:proteic killer suppression protein
MIKIENIFFTQSCRKDTFFRRELLLFRVCVDIFEAILSDRAKAELLQIPAHIVFKLQVWINGVKINGLGEMTKVLSFHDEPLKGKRKGHRSIRLNKAYRAFYIIKKTEGLNFLKWPR